MFGLSPFLHRILASQAITNFAGSMSEQGKIGGLVPFAHANFRSMWQVESLLVSYSVPSDLDEVIMPHYNILGQDKILTNRQKQTLSHVNRHTHGPMSRETEKSRLIFFGGSHFINWQIQIMSQKLFIIFLYNVDIKQCAFS